MTSVEPSSTSTAPAEPLATGRSEPSVGSLCSGYDAVPVTVHTPDCRWPVDHAGTCELPAPELRHYGPFLSLGAGVQSTALLLLSAQGVLPKLVAAIFADTGNEPQAVYDHLDHTDRVPLDQADLRSPAEKAAARGEVGLWDEEPEQGGCSPFSCPSDLPVIDDGEGDAA